MPRLRREVAARVAESLYETEQALDAALTKASGLLGLMPIARQDARLSACTGQDAIDHAAAAIARLSEARRELVEAHKALSEVQKSIGLAEVAFGSFIDKPDWPQKKAMLQVVENKAA
ncbi:hypothetical protein [Thermaurantiacus sp.]